MVWSEEYSSANAFWMALTARARSQAKKAGGRPEQLIGAFVRQAFLTRIFTADSAPWVVAGGTGVLIRLPGARTTDDLDLVRQSPAPSADELAADLKGYTGSSASDPFTFEAVRTESFSGEINGVKVRMRALIGNRRAHEFDVDLTTKDMIGRIESKVPADVVAGMRGVEAPPMPVYPVASQVADKLSAMYRHLRSDQPEVSTRYRDLVDLVLLSLRTSVSAEDLAAAVHQVRTNPVSAIPLPDRLAAPGGAWAQKYPEYAAGTAVPRELRDLDAAVAQVGRWIDPVLAGDVQSERGWDPRAGQWIPGGVVDVAVDDPTIPVAAHTRDDGTTSVTEHRRGRPSRS